MRRFITFIYRILFNRRKIKIFTGLRRYGGNSKEILHAYQIKKLGALIPVINTIPYYKNLGFSSKEFNYKEFQKLPILTKEIIRKHGSSLINTNYQNKNDASKNTSGGSTGEPVVFYRTRDQINHGGANYWYANFLNDVNIYDFSVDLWGAERDMHNVKNKFDLVSFLNNKITLNTFVLSNDIIITYIGKLNHYKPKFIKAYVHSLYEISKFINENNIKIKFTPIIHCTTGPLYPEMRNEIKKAFNDAHVYNFYGSREVSAIATEIEENKGLHVLFDNVFIEILDENNFPAKEGEEGEVVVTTLNNYYMPLIRYKIGDRAIKGDDLTVGTLLLRSVVGRTLGVIHKKDGSKIDGQFFTTLFFNKKGIKNFQLIQKTITELQLNIVKTKDFDVNEMQQIIERIQNEVPESKIEIVVRNEIELTRSGKRMYVYSEL